MVWKAAAGGIKKSNPEKASPFPLLSVFVAQSIEHLNLELLSSLWGDG